MSQGKLKRVLIMAGGTGGHVFPGLAVAHYMRDQGIEIHWLGTQLGLESRLVPAEDFPLHTIKINGLRGKNLKTVLTAPFMLSTAILEAFRIIKSVNPDLIIGMGGFASGPGGVASWMLRRPLIIHEQNAKAGFTNKALFILAKKVLEAFPDTFKHQSKVMTIGNPVRTTIANLPSPEKRWILRKPFHLLVLGGSLGAKALNTLLPQALKNLDPALRPEVLHQTGDAHFEEAKKAYESSSIDVTLKPFIEDMSTAYAWADLVLCRAGALTVSELCAAGLGAIFIPYPHAVDDHQTANANVMVRNQAALCIPQSELTPDRLADLLGGFSESPKKCLSMAQAAYQLKSTNVVEKIYQICEEVFI